MLADPRHRQIGKQFLTVGQAVKFYGVLCGRNNVVEGQYDALWPPGRSRCVEDDRGIAAPALGDLVAKKADSLRANSRPRSWTAA